MTDANFGIVSASILVPFWRLGNVQNPVLAWEGCICWRVQALQDEIVFWLPFLKVWARISSVSSLLFLPAGFPFIEVTTAVYSLQWTVYILQSTIDCLQFMYTPQLRIYNLQSAYLKSEVCNLEYAISNLQSTVCSLQSTRYIQSATYNLQDAVCDLQSTISNLQSKDAV